MHFQYIPYAWFLIASAVITLGLSLYGWRQRHAAGTATFAFLMLAATVWSAANALEMAGTDLTTKLFWANLQYVCYGVVPIAWLALVMTYTGREDRLTSRLIAWLSVEPLITVVLAWTNDWHGLIRRDVWLDTAGPFPVIAKTYGLWFPIHAIYSYILLLVVLYMLIEMLLRTQAIYRQQTRILTLGFLIPLATSVLYTLGLGPFPRQDITPVTLGIAGLAAAWGLYQYRLFDLVPIAHTAVIDGIDDGILVLDAQERVIEINRAAREILGAQASASPIGQPVATVFSAWPDLVEHYHNAPASLSEITLGEGEAQRSYEVRIAPLMDRRDRLTGRLFILRDITRRTRAEHALRTRNRELTLLNSAIQTLTSSLELDQVLADILDQVRDLLYAEIGSVWLIDPATRELVCRLSAGRRKEVVQGWRMLPSEGLVGWTARTGRSAIVPDTLNDARHFRGIDQQTGLDLRSILSAPLCAQDKVIGVLQVADTRPNRFNPDDLNMVEPLVGAAATAIMNARLYETAQQEIAERQRAQEALRQQTIELETRNAELDAFAHTVAHDLKNPLGVVLGYAEMLNLYQESYTPQDRKEVAAEIVHTTQKMNNIIQELLLLSEVRKAEVQLVPLNMGAIVDEARQRLAHMLQTHRGEIRVPEPSAWPMAVGYAPWVEEVWVNYLSNAIKYGGSGGEPPRIELGADVQADGMIRFWTHDTGPGIAPEDQARLFTPFTRLDQVRAAGHGLGLSIVRRIAEKLGGHVSVDSQVGEGSTFSFTLAAYAPQYDEQGIASFLDG